MEKTKHKTTKARVHQSKNGTTTQILKPGVVAFYHIQPGNGAGLFSKEKISKREDK